MLRVRSLHTYPVKACHGIALQEAILTPAGILGDRRWMIVDENGVFRTQRELPRMALILPDPGEDRLRLQAPGITTLELPYAADHRARLPVRVWNDTCEAEDWGSEAASWLSEFLQCDCRLVSMAPGFVRPVDPAYSRPGDRVRFADGFPLLLTNEASLEDLNRRLEQPIPMDRFRPSIVVAGAEAFAEDHWRVLRISGVKLRVVKPCGRCVVTAVDQDRGASTGDEPLRTLASFRTVHRPGKSPAILFGQNAVPDLPAQAGHVLLRIGDPVTVVEGAQP